ncbi:hypothetical protein MRX96_035723 [Rhipicephalus microplus]
MLKASSFNSPLELVHVYHSGHNTVALSYLPLEESQRGTRRRARIASQPLKEQPTRGLRKVSRDAPADANKHSRQRDNIIRDSSQHPKEHCACGKVVAIPPK